MKKAAVLFIICTTILALSACGSRPAQSSVGTDAGGNTHSSEVEGFMKDQDTTVPAQEENSADGQQGGILVAYFSHTGNTETIANMIAEYTGGDLFQVETTTVYPDEYNDLIAQARQEQDDDARPELASSVEDMDAYDTIFIGYPNWWGTMPMTMFTFLESYDFSGKTIIPFCTHEGSALGRSERDITELIPDAELLEGLAIRGSNVDSAGSDVTHWLEELGFRSPTGGK